MKQPRLKKIEISTRVIAARLGWVYTMNTLNKDKICASLLIAIAVVQMLTIFKIPILKDINAVFGILIIIFAYSGLSSSFRKMTLAFLGLGAVINLTSNQPMESWISGINYMLNISAILVIMQLFTIPIRLGDYAGSFKHLILKVFHTERSIYCFSTLVIHMFSSILLFGTIPVMLSLLGEPLKQIVKDYKRFMGTSLVRGYATVVMWAPGAVNILLVLNSTGARWVDIFFIGVTLSVLGLLLAIAFQFPYLSDEKIPCEIGNQEQDKIKTKEAFTKLGYIFLIIIILVVFILLFDYLNIGQGSTYRVMLASLILASAWIMLNRNHPNFELELKEYFQVSLKKMVDLACMYVGLGVFSLSLETSGILAGFTPYVAFIAERTGIFMVPVASFLVCVLAFIGVHPFVLLVLLGKLLVSMPLTFGPHILACALMFGATVSYMSSPFAGIMLTASKFLDTTVYEIGIRWNGRFCITYFILGNIIIMLWNYLS